MSKNIKSTDRTLLLHHDSFHPNYCKTSIIHSQALRYRRLITNNDTVHKHLDNLRIILITRGYSQHTIHTAFQKSLQFTQHDLIHKHSNTNTNNTDNTNDPPPLSFSIPFNSNTTHIGSILRKHWHLIDIDTTLNILWPETIDSKTNLYTLNSLSTNSTKYSHIRTIRRNTTTWWWNARIRIATFSPRKWNQDNHWMPTTTPHKIRMKNVNRARTDRRTIPGLNQGRNNTMVWNKPHDNRAKQGRPSTYEEKPKQFIQFCLHIFHSYYRASFQFLCFNHKFYRRFKRWTYIINKQFQLIS